MHGLKVVLCLCVLATIILTACISDVPSLPPTSTPEPTLEPTATIQWFPPTKTPTLMPIFDVTPTEIMNPGIGEVLYEDDFSDNAAWQTFEKPEGNAAVANHNLTLTIPLKGSRIYSLLIGKTYNDFYMEITAKPVLCKDADAYGVLFRVSSIQDYYRLILNCYGQAKLERVRNGIVNVLQDWSLSSELVPGAGLPVKIGIWARGASLRIFFNGIYMFGAVDGTFSTGQVGAHARSENPTAVTVNFSDLTIRALEP